MAGNVRKQIARLNQEIEQLRQQEHYEEALLLATQLRDIALQAFGATHPSFAEALHTLASLYWATNEQAAAERLLMQELEIWSRAQGKERLNAVATLHILGDLTSARGDYIQAKSFYQNAIELLRMGLGEATQMLPYFADHVNELGLVYQKLGSYEEAESALREALEIRRRVFGTQHPEVAKSLNNLAELYKEFGRLTEAEALLREGLKIMRAAVGEEDPSLAIYLNNLSKLYLRAQDYTNAEPLLQQLLRIQQRSVGEEHPHFLHTLSNLAHMYQETGRYAEAEGLLQQAVETQRRTLGEQHPDVTTSLRRLAGLYEAMGQYDQAEPLLQQVVVIEQRTLGENHPDVAGYLLDLATVLRILGRYPEAVRSTRTALEIYRTAFGADDPNVATCLNNLGFLYFVTGYYADAERHYQEAIKIRKKALSEDHPDMVTSLNNLAELYRVMGKYAQAEPLFQQALNIRRTAYGEFHSDTGQSVNNLAACYSSMGKYTQAAQLYREGLDIRRRTLGEQHPEVADSLNNLGLLYYKMGNYSTAEILLHQALNLRHQLLGTTHPDVADSLDGLAALYSTTGQYTTAKDLFQEALDIRRSALGEEHPAVAAAIAHIGLLSSDTATAVYLLKRAREIQRASLGEAHPDYARNLTNLAYLYQKMGDDASAEQLALQALEIQRVALGEAHPDIAESLNNLAVLYYRRGEDARAEELYQQALEIVDRSLGEQHPVAGGIRQNLLFLYAKRQRAAEAMALMQQSEKITDQLINQVFAMRSEGQRMAYLATLQNSFHSFLSLVSEQLKHSAPAVRAALDLTLRRKALAAEALAAQRDEVLSGRYPGLAPKLEQLATLRRQIAQITLEGPKLEGPAALQPYFLAQWTEQRDKLEAELAREIPELNLEQRLRAADRQAIALALPQSSVLVEFVSFNVVDFMAVTGQGMPQWKPGHYLAFILVAGEPDNIRMIDLGESQPIDQMIATFIAAITTPGRSQDRRDLVPEVASSESATMSEAGAQLRAAVFDSLVAGLEGRTRLFLAPDGDLALLPFEVLPTVDGRFVIDDYQISYLSVGREVLRFGIPSTGPKAQALVIADPDYNLQGNPAAVPENVGPIPERYSRDLNRGTLHFRRLQGTRTEGLEVARLLKVAPLLGRDALEAIVKTSHSPHVLHLASHGFFLPNQSHDTDEEKPPLIYVAGTSSDRLARLSHLENPLLRSGLALAGANTWNHGGVLPIEAEDGLLTAEDVSGLDLLHTDLVVLSACETGLGEIHKGEGVFGLRRTFALAGARRLVMSLWKVHDEETQHLMVDFYRRIQHGQGCAEALRQVQLAMKEQGHDPYNWGAFIFQGDPGPL